MEFHAHIYFDPTQGPQSRESVVKIREFFLGCGWPGLQVGPIEDELRGPHSRPMFEFEFGEALFKDVALWLLLNRGEHVALVHAVTGNDLVDHDRHAIWLGEPLELDRTRLDPPQPNWMLPQVGWTHSSNP
jgi:aromatic ring-cleaving dioxygenase